MLEKDRYISFENIDCYNNAKLVLDAIYELFVDIPEAKNEFWERFETKLPEDYANTPLDDLGRDTLYQVCSNVFYIEELFERFEFQKGLDALQVTEFDCC
ncbi:MAG: N(2)-fixation sustaining protein CowN [Sulfurimonas sp.]|nr:N(2)-fixation sustaining protein CowN [Sulfurimonas sp.]